MVPATLAIAWLALGCEPTVLIGTCAEAASGGTAGASAAANADAVTMPWSTSFEQGLCDYHSAQGYCYARHAASLSIVSSPTPHTGKYMAAFTVNADDSTADRSQTRCVRQGVMPQTAYYGAWYFIPELHTSDGNWNLFHFLGGVSEVDSHPLWDVSLVTVDGKLELYVLNFLNRTRSAVSGVPPVPIGSWFHVELKLVRSAQANGELTLYQDGEVALHLTKVMTDDTDWGQWYVGNYAKTLTPALSTVYVDDVTIREEQ